MHILEIIIKKKKKKKDLANSYHCFLCVLGDADLNLKTAITLKQSKRKVDCAKCSKKLFTNDKMGYVHLHVFYNTQILRAILNLTRY